MVDSQRLWPWSWFPAQPHHCGENTGAWPSGPLSREGHKQEGGRSSPQPTEPPSLAALRRFSAQVSYLRDRNSFIFSILFVNIKILKYLQQINTRGHNKLHCWEPSLGLGEEMPDPHACPPLSPPPPPHTTFPSPARGIKTPWKPGAKWEAPQPFPQTHRKLHLPPPPEHIHSPGSRTPGPTPRALIPPRAALPGPPHL